MPMQLKTIERDGATFAEVKDGKVVYVDGDTEVLFDAVYTSSKITSLNKEAQKNRERYETAESKLQAYEGLDDPEKARQALDTVSKLDAQKLIDAGEVDRVKSEATKEYNRQVEELKKKFKPVEDERNLLKSQLYNERLSNKFAHSEFVAKELSIPPEVAQAFFGAAFFEGKDGKLQAKGADGEVIYGRGDHAGEIADFEEALAKLVEEYPRREQILKGSGSSGGGGGGYRTNSGGKREVSRKELRAMSPDERSKTVRDPSVAIVD